LMDTVDGIEKVIVLMVINLCFPTLRPQCQSLCEIPLASFKSVTKIEQYAKAIETFGVTKDLLGRLFVLGNTGAGKSSFMRTLQSYGQNPNRPKTCLTGMEINKELEKTKFLELIEDVKLSGNVKINIENHASKHYTMLRTEPSLDKKQAFGFVNTMTNRLGKIKIPHNSAQNVTLKETDGKNVTVTVTDFGGHTEYLLSCKLFFTNNGLYVIMFEAAKISPDNYITNIGTFVNEVLSNCSSPIICLMASQCDRAVGKDLSYVVGLVKEHIKLAFEGQMDHSSLTSNSTVFLLDDVLKSSYKVINKPSLERLPPSLPLS
jgi:GTPase SAR1 family protein